MWHKATEDSRPKTQSLKKENKLCDPENNAHCTKKNKKKTHLGENERENMSFGLEKTEPILISAHGWVGGLGGDMVVLWHLIGLRSRELKPAMSFQSII